MKKHTIQGAMLPMSFVAILLIFASCDTDQRSMDTKVVAEERNEQNFDEKDQERDAQFLVNAAEINLQEIQLAKLAQQKGTAPHIKELGKQLEATHNKSQNELIILAKRKQISIPVSPTDDSQDAYKKLNDQSGDDFDQLYANMMVRGHQDAIDAYEKASNDDRDIDIRNWATASLTDLRRDLDRSVVCQKKLDNMSLEKDKN